MKILNVPTAESVTWRFGVGSQMGFYHDRQDKSPTPRLLYKPWSLGVWPVET